MVYIKHIIPLYALFIAHSLNLPSGKYGLLPAAVLSYTETMIYGFLTKIFDILAKAAAALFLYRQGAKNERAKQNEKALKDIRKKMDIHSRLDRDDDYASRVRDKFRRD